MRGNRKGPSMWRSLIRVEALPRVLLVASLLAASFLAVAPARADDDDDEPGSITDRISDGLKKAVSGVGSKVGLGAKPEGPPPVESPSGCPTISVLDGTNAQRVMAANASGNQGVRYQFSLGNVGRQCSLGGGRVLIKVAADGRVLLGPSGSAGRFDVPIRVVVFNEGQQKPVVSKLYKVPASIGAGQSGTPFQFLSDDIVVPATSNVAREYSIKVGIDSGKGGGEATVGKKRSRRQKQPVAAAQ